MTALPHRKRVKVETGKGENKGNEERKVKGRKKEREERNKWKRNILHR